MPEMYQFLGLTVGSWVLFAVTLLVDRWRAAASPAQANPPRCQRRLAA